MTDSLIANFPHFDLGWRDLLDIVLMAVLIYQVGLLIRGTRALQTLIGVLLVMVVYGLTGPDRILSLATVHRVLGYVLFYAPFAIIILFQTTIRRALARLGRTPLLRLGQPELTDKMLGDLVHAATDLAGRRHGALIVIEREQALPDQIDSGIQLDAAISYDLLMNIFTPGSPMHDGAVIIGERRVKAASCFVQVTTDPQLARQYGSRHRAAIGLTEEYDSLALVISEERGEIRGAVEGRLTPPMDGEALRLYLRTHLGGGRATAPAQRNGARRTDAA